MDSDLSNTSSTFYEGGGKKTGLVDVDKDNDSDIDNLDFNNFKGIYIDEDPNRKF